MIINEAGEYKLQYTATDACGNSTTVQRDLVVEAPPRTVLYTDGTFIINELSRDIEANIQAHGQPTNIYAPFNPNGATDADKYTFSSDLQRPWYNQIASIISVEIGSNIQPTSTRNWFFNMNNLVNVNLDNLDTSAVTDMKSMFGLCKALISLDLSNFNTSAVTNMAGMFQECKMLASLNVSNFDTSAVTNTESMFYECDALTVLDVSNFDTSAVTDMSYMFGGCDILATIYASALFVVSQVISSSNMFINMSPHLVGGAGTGWTSRNPRDKTYAHIDGGTSDPGYFTARS